MSNLKNVNTCNTRITIGSLPTAFMESLSYWEGLNVLVNKMNEIIDFANNELTQELKEYINQEFNNILLDTMYDAETETLIMYITREDE